MLDSANLKTTIHDLLISKTYQHLGNIPLYGTDMFNDMTDVMDFVNSAKHKYIRNMLSMYEIHQMQDEPNCPIMIKDIVNKLKTVKLYNSRAMNVVGFTGLDGAVGYNWHSDVYHLIAMNIIGNTTWYFKDGNTIDMKPGDLLFVPSPVEHTVIGNGERFTISFCAPIKNGKHNINN